MDRNIIKHIFILSFLIVHYVQLTKASSAGCLLNPNVCNLDEFCHQGYLLGKCVKRSEIEGYYYGNSPGWYSRDEDSVNNDLNTRRGDIPQWKETYRQQNYDSSEPTLEDKTLIQSLPLDNKDLRNSYPDRENRLPAKIRPQTIGTRDGISVNNGASIPDNQDREYHSDTLEEPHQTFHEANEQISIEHISEPAETKTLHESNDENDVDANSKVMIKGEVKKAESSIDQGPNPEKNYERIKDFFKSQQASSIVDVPNAVKREEASKVNKKNFVPIDMKVKDEVNAEQVSQDDSEKSLKIDLDRRVEKTGVKLQRIKNDYSPEDESEIAKRINKDASVKEGVARQVGVRIMKADDDTPSKYNNKIEQSVNQQPKYFAITLITAGCVTGVILSAVAIYLIMKRYNETKKFKPVTLPGQEAAAEYQELCRQFRASQGWEGSPIKPTDKDKALGSAKPPPYSWSEEPVVPNMDISTGHVVLAYMEDHLKNKDRLNKEWEALCTYEAEPNKTDIGKQDKNVRKNRYSDVLPYDHNRVVLRETANATGSDYVNASFITDHDPRNPAYIATQGPLAHTISDFWQMIWEQGVVVVVNLTRLSDLGLPQCNRYWPEEGHETYHIYEVHLVSEHIWCDDYLVRSFYLKNLQTSETRTVTQFHFLSWPDLNVPTNPKPLLEFRRKVNKCFRGRSCPIVVHCSGGVGRTGCYILIDMVLNKMMRGAKEIDIAATVEHLRDQRPLMVKTKAQFEFALTAVAEEVSAILQALAK